MATRTDHERKQHFISLDFVLYEAGINL